jgi:phosphatidylglycerophosphate synthase
VGAASGGNAVLEGRVGLRGFLSFYREALGHFRGNRHLQLSFAFWAGSGFLFTEALGIGVAQMDSRRWVVAAAILCAVWWVLVSIVLAGGAALLTTPHDGARLDFYGVPNGLTALRAYAVVPLMITASVSTPGRTGFVIWCATAGVTGMLDAVDGFIARRVGPLTELGRAFDPGMDAVFFSAAAYAAWRLGIMPFWLMIFIYVRYLGPLALTPLVFLARRRPELVHTNWGRRNTLYIGVVVFILMWVKIAGGPVDAVALGMGAPLLGITAVLHFWSLAVRTYRAPVVRERRAPRLRKQ